MSIFDWINGDDIQEQDDTDQGDIMDTEAWTESSQQQLDQLDPTDLDY